MSITKIGDANRLRGLALEIINRHRLMPRPDFRAHERVRRHQHGGFPSQVCRQIPGIEPVMSVKARVAAIQKLKPGEVVGYGMRYTATTERRIAVLPIGYGDGFPRVRNEGGALIRGKRAPLIGGIAMDALMVDITDIPQAQMWDEAVIMGKQGSEEITVRDIAKLKNSVTYDVLTNWRLRLRRKSVNGQTKSVREFETTAAK